LSVKTLNDMGLTNASHIETGIVGWKADGLPIVSYEEWKAARES
jgi:rhodanese-related sulfurtransferase